MIELTEKKVLVIAGSDPSGGAGMQADLLTLQDFNVPALFSVTAITAQNNSRVLEIHPTPADILTQQLSGACKDQKIGVIKIGMIATAANVHALVWFLHCTHFPHLVIDPVFHSSSGASLLETKAQAPYRKQLLPLATVITPNLLEASALAGMQVSSLEQMQQAAEIIFRELYSMRGAKAEEKPLAVVIKGGHLKSDPIDIMYDGNEFHEFRSPRIPGRSPRGTGCRFASSIAAGLSQGKPILDSIIAAKKYLTSYIQKNSIKALP